MTRTLVWLLLLVIHISNEINSATGHFSAVKTPRFKRAGADSPAEVYSFYGPDSPPNLLYDNQQLQPQIQEPTVNFTIDHPTLTGVHQNWQPITTIDHQLQSQVQHHEHELVFGHQTLDHEPAHQIHPQHSVPFQFQGEAVTEKRKSTTSERRRRARNKDAIHNLGLSIGKDLSITQTYLAACALINELCLKLRLWKSRDAQMQEEQKCFHENLQIVYDELAKHSIDKKLWPTFNQAPLPPLFSSDVDIYMSTANVDLDKYREMPEATDDDDNINEPMAKQNQQTAHVINERRRRKHGKTVLDVLNKMIPLTPETLRINNKSDKITAATSYIQKLKTLQKEHENAEMYYAKLSEDFAQHMNVIKNFFSERGVPMPALSYCDRKGKRVKIGHEHQSSPRNSSSSSGNSGGGKGVQPQMMGLSADDHFLQAAMASSSHHPHGLMPFGEASSSQHPHPPLHQQHTGIPMQQGMESGRNESGHGLHGYHWPDFTSNSGDDDMHLFDNPALFDMVRSTQENNPVDVEQLKKALQEHKIEKAQLQDIICHQEALIEEQNELGGIIVNNLMTSNTKLNDFLHENGIQIHNCDLLPVVVDPLPEGQISLIHEVVNLADLALRVTLWPTLPNAIEHEKLIVSRGLLLMDEFLVTCVHKLNCFLLFRSRPIHQLTTEVRQRIKAFKPMRLKTANVLEMMVEEAEKEIGSFRQQMTHFNTGAYYLKHLEPMWNLRFYEHIYKAILIRLPSPTFAEGYVTTGNEERMLANARKLLVMAIQQIAEDLNIFDNPNHIEEKLAQKRNQCDIK